jgi:hypothetical protein
MSIRDTPTRTRMVITLFLWDVDVIFRGKKMKSKQLFDMWREEHEASRSPMARRELEQILPYVKELESMVKELEDRITVLGWEVENARELRYAEREHW